MKVEINATIDTLNLGIKKCLKDIAERRAINKFNRLKSDIFNTGPLVQFLNNDNLKISRSSNGFINTVNNEINEMLGYYIFKEHHKFLLEVEAEILEFSEKLLKIAEHHRELLNILNIEIDPQKILNSQNIELDFFKDPFCEEKMEIQLILSYGTDSLTLREKFYYSKTYEYISKIGRLNN